jgi:signal peptidase I
MQKGGTSKANLIKIALLLVVALSATVVCTFVFQIFHPASLWYMALLGLMLLLVWLAVGFRPRRSVDGAAACQIVAVYLLIYLLIIYGLGLVTGFLRSGYSQAPLMILYNILPVIGITVLTELLRYAFVKRIGDNRLALAGVIAGFSLLQIMVGSTVYNLGTPLELFEMIGRLVMGGIAANVMLTYLAYKSDFRPGLIYALILGLYPLLIPVLPDLGAFIYSVLAIMLPILLFVRFNEFFITRRPIPGRQKASGRILWSLPMVAVLATMVILISGIFRYWAMAIGSSSMSPDINIGDVVIIDKGYGSMDEVEMGSVLAFWHDNRVVAHRLIEAKQDASGLKIQTKGDNNADNDAWAVRESDVVGVVRLKIPLIGWPTVWLDRTY